MPPALAIISLHMSIFNICIFKIVFQKKLLRRMALIYVFLSYWDSNLGPTPWATPPALCEVFLQ
jgi:hypothetical protein